MIQYFFPYKHLIGEEWMEVLREFVPRFAGAGDELEYKLAVLELIARIHDTHANVRGFDKALESFNGTKFAPVRISFVQNKAVVTARLNGQFNPPTPLREGDIILSVNDQPVEEIVKSRLYRTPASNYPTQLRLIASNLLRSNDSTITVSLDRDGVTTRITVACYTPGELNLQAVSQRKDTSWKLLSKDVGYIFPGTVKNSILPEIMSAFAGTRGIVIDMRCYPSEFIVFTLGQYLMPQPTPFVKFTFGDVMRPGLFTFGPALRVGKFNSDYYRGKVVILVNETTISQAEYTTMAFSVAPNATIIGSTTSGADGNVSPITLPGGISTMISGIGVYYPDGTETQRIGIVPDIELRPTLKGIREKRDELLERAIELIQAGK
jgi:C-terminal processing protease CtpA/Prc